MLLFDGILISGGLQNILKLSPKNENPCYVRTCFLCFFCQKSSHFRLDGTIEAIETITAESEISYYINPAPPLRMLMLSPD